MAISQNIESLEEELNFEHQIKTSVGEGKFLAITENYVEEGSNQRVIKAQILPMEGAPGGDVEAKVVLVKKEGEQSIKTIILNEDGTELENSEATY